MNPYIDPMTVTLGEIAVIEDITNLTIEEILAGLDSRLWVESSSFLIACMFVLANRVERTELVDISSMVFASIEWGAPEQEETDGGV